MGGRAPRPRAARYDRTRGRLAEMAMSHLPLAVAVMDRHLRLAYWNAHAGALWGLPPLLSAEHPPLREALGGIAAMSAGQCDRLVAFCAEHVDWGDRVEPKSWLRITCGRDRRLCVQVTGVGRGHWMLVLNDGRGGILTDRPTHGTAGDAWLDALTGLRNRRQFNLMLEESFESGLATGEQALLLVDVNGLEAINETHGRTAGDSLLCVMARRMERDLREDDTLARFADGTFAILVPHGAPALADRLLDMLSRPFLVEDRMIEASFALGIASLSAAAGSADRLLDQALAALRAAKATGANRWAIFEQASAGGPPTETGS